MVNVRSPVLCCVLVWFLVFPCSRMRRASEDWGEGADWARGGICPLDQAFMSGSSAGTDPHPQQHQHQHQQYCCPYAPHYQLSFDDESLDTEDWDEDEVERQWHTVTCQ